VVGVESPNRLERQGDGVEIVISMSMTCGQLCKFCNPYRRTFPLSWKMRQRTRNKIAHGGCPTLWELPV